MEAELGSNLRGRTSKMNLTMRLLLFFLGLATKSIGS